MAAGREPVRKQDKLAEHKQVAHKQAVHIQAAHKQDHSMGRIRRIPRR